MLALEDERENFLPEYFASTGHYYQPNVHCTLYTTKLK